MATVNYYDVGDLVRLSVKFTRQDTGDPIDPTNVTCKYRSPDGTEVTKVFPTDIEIIHDGSGAFHIDVAPGQQGAWKYRFAGTGSAIGAGAQEFYVNDYVF